MATRHKRLTIVFGLFLLVSLAAWASGTSENSASGSARPTLSIMCFEGYADQSWVKPFEQKYNVNVKITYSGTVDEMFTKVKSAPDQYNIVSIDAGRVKLYKDSELLQPIDTSKLSNYDKISKFFRTYPYQNPNDKYHVPIVWGTQTITINTKQITPDQLKPFLGNGGKTVSLKVLTAPQFKGETAFFDESTNVVEIAAIEQGVKDIFNFGPSDWTKVSDQLTAWKNNARTFTHGLDSEFEVLTSGDAYILLGGNDALLNLRLAKAGVQQNFTQYPMTEGTIAWLDGWVITKPTKGASLNAAYEYINYMIGDQGQKELAQLVGFGVVNPAGGTAYAQPVKDSTWWYAKGIDSFPAPLHIMIAEENPAKRVELWNRVKAQ